MSYNNVEQKTENIVDVNEIMDAEDMGEKQVIPTDDDKRKRNLIVGISLGIVFCCVVAYVLYKIGGN